MKTVLLSLLLVLGLSANSFEAGDEAYENEDFKKAFSLWESAAKKGDRRSQVSLAVMYEDGDDIPQDSAKALYWYEKAALQGDIDSQLILAMSYCYGDGVKKNVKTCAKWAKMAKDRGANVAILWSEFKLAQQ